MHRYLATGLLVLAATGCSAEVGQGDASEPDGVVGETQQTLGSSGKHFVYPLPAFYSIGGVAGYTHCPTGEFLRGVDPANGRRMVCEPTPVPFDSGYTDRVVQRIASGYGKGTASCGNFSVAVGWNGSTGAIICRVLGGGDSLAGRSPLGADTTTAAQLSYDSHKTTYWAFTNPDGGYADEMPICITRASDGAIAELTTKLITYGTAPNTYQVNTFFYTCGY